MPKIIITNKDVCEIAFGKDYVYDPEGYIIWTKVIGTELKSGKNVINATDDLLKNGFRFIRNADVVKSVTFGDISKDLIASMKGLFMGCENLITIDFNGLDSSKVTEMSNLFNGCHSIKDIDLKCLDTSLVMSMNGMLCVD